MTKTVTIDWKGGSRRIELQNPGKMKRLHHIATAPTPLKMSPKALAWMNTTILLGSELDMDTIESMRFTDGLGLLSEVLGHWGEQGDEQDDETTDGDVQEALDGIELDDQGAVSLEDMQ